MARGPGASDAELTQLHNDSQALAFQLGQALQALPAQTPPVNTAVREASPDFWLRCWEITAKMLPRRSRSDVV